MSAALKPMPQLAQTAAETLVWNDGVSGPVELAYRFTLAGLRKARNRCVLQSVGDHLVRPAVGDEPNRTPSAEELHAPGTGITDAVRDSRCRPLLCQHAGLQAAGLAGKFSWPEHADAMAIIIRKLGAIAPGMQMPLRRPVPRFDSMDTWL